MKDFIELRKLKPEMNLDTYEYLTNYNFVVYSMEPFM